MYCLKEKYYVIFYLENNPKIPNDRLYYNLKKKINTPYTWDLFVLDTLQQVTSLNKIMLFI